MYSPDQIELQSYFYIFSARPSTASAASRIGEHFNKSVRMSDAQRAAIGREWKLPGLVGAPFPFELLLGIADPGNFGRGINDPGNTGKIEMQFLPVDDLGDHHALVFRFVREHRAAHHIANSLDTRRERAAMIVHIDKTAFVYV